MVKTIRRVTDIREQNAENYRYWQGLPPGQRLAAVWEVTRNAYAFKGVDVDGTEHGSPRTLIRLKRQ
jgi:hypothetical protein